MYWPATSTFINNLSRYEKEVLQRYIHDAPKKPVWRHTSVPVPRVISWLSDSWNAVAAEYIIMEKATDVPLFQERDSMTEFDKLLQIENLTRLEAQLAKIEFPTYGGL